MEQVLQELRKEAKVQLFHYPVFTKKQDIKYLIKRLLRPANTPKRDPFFWTHAMLAQGLEEAGELEVLKQYYDLWIERDLPVHNVDNIMNGYSLLYVYEQTKDEKYKAAADKLYQYLLQYKSEMNETIPYRKNHPTHIYVDGLGMIVPFLCRYGKMFGNQEAIKLGVSQMKEFVESLPEGLDTSVGERGVRISGGQRQRIGIARALYHNPEILVFDEATSALDTETETAIMEAIDSFHGKKTLIIIAHRLRTIENCDIIYRVENGKITRTTLEEK